MILGRIIMRIFSGCSICLGYYLIKLETTDLTPEEKMKGKKVLPIIGQTGKTHCCMWGLYV